MDFLSLDPSQWLNAIPSANNPFSAMLILITNGGWILIFIVIVWGLWMAWLEYIRNKFSNSIKYNLLAIDVPKLNEQSPKAVEHIFSHFYGMLNKGNLKEKYLRGYTQYCISLEIVSIEGYIQFLIRTPSIYRDLIEAAIYAQYPDAEITEVEDYINMFPKPLELPHPDYDLWGAEIKLSNKQFYPIKTYPLFEHTLTQKFLDPMASLLELMSRMGPGEQLWLQILVEPVNNSWRQKGMELINKLIGKKTENKKSLDFLYFPREITKGLTESFTAAIMPTTEMGGIANQKKEREWPSMMQHLSPAEREIVEAVGMKISKLGFLTKIRFIYSGKRGLMKKEKGVNGTVGAFQQFSSQNLNGFNICKKTRTKIDYFFIKSRLLARQRRILWGYRYRSMKRGRNRYILNTEELASLWHFPVSEFGIVPAVQVVGAKKAQGPISLPIEPSELPISGISAKVHEKGSPPPNLPI